jgi:hypothetical protein
MARMRCVLAVAVTLGLLGCNAEPKRVDDRGRVLLESSMTKHNVWVDIQIVWKDAKGFKVYETNWAPMMLPARYVSTHEIVSMRADVADYEYRVRGGSKTVAPFGKF